MTQLIHINDNNLLIQAGAKQFRAQGYAWLKGGDVIFDSDSALSPVKHCRLAPQEINNRYWLQCDESSVAGNGAGMRHAADLIWRHLTELTQRYDLTSTVLVTPSHYRQSNLQLLLGVAKSSGLTVSGLVNKAVLSLHDQALDDGDYTHLDVQLHQMVSSKLHLSNGVLKLGGVEIIQDVGIHAMQEALLKGLQQSFIQNDRFDPLHDAGTEQQLFDQLPDLMQQINEAGKANVSVQHQSRLHSTSLDVKAWNSVLDSFVKRILSVAASTNSQHVYIDLNSAFDGAAPQMLSGAGLTISSGLRQASRASIEMLQQQDAGSVIHLTELPVVGDKARRSPQKAPAENIQSATRSTPASAATHLLHAGKAVAIHHAMVTTDNNTLGVKQGEANVESMLTSGKLYVMNDEGRHELQPNDRLGSQFADGVVSVIQVL